MLFGDFTSTFVLVLLLETVLMFLSHLKHLKYLKHHEIRSVTVSSSSCASRLKLTSYSRSLSTSYNKI